MQSTNPWRVRLERLRDRISQAAVDTVYVHSPDRLARRDAHQVLLLDEFASHGVRVTTIEGRNGESRQMTRDQMTRDLDGRERRARPSPRPTYPSAAV